MEQPLNDEVAAALARFFHAGAGPSHASLTRAFTGAGYADDAPYDPVQQTPNKENRVLAACRAAVRRPSGARKLADSLLLALRMENVFTDEEQKIAVSGLRRAFTRTGYVLDDAGYISPIGAIHLETAGREALEEQLERIRRSTEDPAQLIGSAKDLLEAVAKFVLEEEQMLPSSKTDFNHLWYLARERLGVLPQQVPEATPGASQAKAILQSSWKIAEQVNELRNMQGTGHGRTLPTAISADMALMVVREACSVAQFMLSRLDRR